MILFPIIFIALLGTAAAAFVSFVSRKRMRAACVGRCLRRPHHRGSFAAPRVEPGHAARKPFGAGDASCSLSPANCRAARMVQFVGFAVPCGPLAAPMEVVRSVPRTLPTYRRALFLPGVPDTSPPPPPPPWDLAACGVSFRTPRTSSAKSPGVPKDTLLGPLCNRGMWWSPCWCV